MSAFDQADALVRFWLHTPPAESWDEWRQQVSQALFLEERYITLLGKLRG